MCGRFTSLLTPELLCIIYELATSPVCEQSYNIAPTQQALVVRSDFSGNRHAAPLRWGLIPPWARDTTGSARMINARSETVHDKPSFCQAIRSRRCIVPASGFYEWMHAGANKEPYYITMKDGSPQSLAGIWETWTAPDNTIVESFSILTTAANSLMAPIHDRMPVILHAAEIALWLDRAIDSPQELQRLYQPYPSELLQTWPVSSLVNSPRNNGPELLEPT